MTEEARRTVAALRHCFFYDIDCKNCPSTDECDWHSETMPLKAADLIESLSAQLEQVTREMDALLKELRGDCGICKHWQECRDSDYSRDVNYNNCWEWRGVEVEE